MRTLDIEFEGQQHPQPPLNNGFRPHGGYRGTNRYPLSQYTFNKSVDDRKKLKDDLDRLFGSDSLESLPSPFYAISASKESTHSGESPLFEHQLLAPSRLEQKLSTEEYVKEYLPSTAPRKKVLSRPSSGVQYYRPESPHHYMAATTTTSANQEDPSVKYGRPTRTTLLRARNRCNSAPVNIYKMRKEVQKQYEQKVENRRPKTASVTVKDLLNSSVTEGETIHSFLIGARYNRAHCLDSKSVADHGVYMPRGNPLGCFITRDRLREEEEEEEVPPSTPDSLMSHSDNDEDPPSPKHKQAWSTGQTERKKVNKHDITLMQHYINTEDGLNVKGTCMDDSSKKQNHHQNQKMTINTKKKPMSRPNSSRINYQPRSARAQSARLSGQAQSGGGGAKPFVLIQGKSLPRGTKSLEQATGSSTNNHVQKRQAHHNNGISTSRESSSSSLSNHNPRNLNGHLTVDRSARQRVKSGRARVSNNNSVSGLNSTQDWERENGLASPVSSVHFRPKSSRGGVAHSNRQEIHSNVNGEDKSTPVRNGIEAAFDVKQEGSEENDRLSTSVENGAPSEIKEDVTIEGATNSMGDSETGRDEQEVDEDEGGSLVTGGENVNEEKETVVVDNVRQESTNQNQLEMKRTSRVRFADEIEEIDEGRSVNKGESQVGQGDNARFFITEDRDGGEVQPNAHENAHSMEGNAQNMEGNADANAQNSEGNAQENAHNMEGNAQANAQNIDENAERNNSDSEVFTTTQEFADNLVKSEQSQSEKESSGSIVKESDNSNGRGSASDFDSDTVETAPNVSETGVGKEKDLESEQVLEGEKLGFSEDGDIAKEYLEETSGQTVETGEDNSSVGQG